MRLILVTALLLIGFSAHTAIGQSTQPALRQLQSLAAELQRVAPPEYLVELSPGGVSRAPSRYDVPTIIVETRSAVIVRQAIANAAAGQGLESPTIERVTLIWAMRPYVAPEQFASISSENKRESRRMDFVKKLQAAGVAWGHMGPAPIPPRTFDPRSDSERQLVREYQLLWLETEPQRLPTHRFGNLSFELIHDPMKMIVDERQASSFQEMIRRVQGVLIPYEPAR